MKIIPVFVFAAAILILGGCSHITPDSVSATVQDQSIENSLEGDGTSELAETEIQRDVPDPLPPPVNDSIGPSEVQQPDSAGVAIGADRKEQSMLDEALDFCDVAQAFWQKGELENALDALDKAYSLILEIERDDAKLIQQKEDLRYLISKRILEIYASRNIVVNGNHKEIPLEMNPHVEAELKRFTGYEKDFFQQSYQRSGRYRTHILEALKKAGLPEELSWLPLIESGYKVKALSRARALGLWQFIPSTGYKFGLKRNQYVDERIDFMKATEAAIAYLKELHAIFGDWMTVLAAYNCGEGRVLQVIRTQNVNYLDNFWDLYQRLPSETARYVPRFLATLHMIKNPRQYGLDQLSLEPPVQFEEIEINRQVHLKDISAAVGIDLEELKLLNPELRYQILPPEPYSLKIPPLQTETVQASLETVPVSSLPQHYLRETQWHRVRSGETLSSIAQRYRMSVKEIMRLNNLKRPDLIRAGKSLRVSRPLVREVRSVQAGRSTSGTHRVRQGDSLYILAKRYGTTVEQIKAENNLSSNMLHIGQTLVIPGTLQNTGAETARAGSTYSVQSGDTPSMIAQKHNMDLNRFLKINHLTGSSKIYPGQQVHVD